MNNMKHVDAYVQRREAVDAELRRLASELKKQGCRVYHVRDVPYIEWFMITKETLRTYVGYAEVPYHWWADSGCRSFIGGSQMEGGSDTVCPFSVEDVMSTLDTPRRSGIDSMYVEF